ncbi:hypothetical protein LTR17_016532 [Elasticomyces elasticus]|nr:hypothetical protein LTR17_016532 [Elasticomyces elasticus]
MFQSGTVICLVPEGTDHPMDSVPEKTDPLAGLSTTTGQEKTMVRVIVVERGTDAMVQHFGYYRLRLPPPDAPFDGGIWDSRTAAFHETVRQLEVEEGISLLRGDQRVQAEQAEAIRQSQWRARFDGLVQEETARGFFVIGSRDGWYPEEMLQM